MLMIGTNELAKRLYEVWRARAEVLRPLTTKGVNVSDGYPVRRSKWEHLNSNQQEVWRSVAEEAGKVMADAMGAL